MIAGGLRCGSAAVRPYRADFRALPRKPEIQDRNKQPGSSHRWASAKKIDQMG
jgi:hypothetical protein